MNSLRYISLALFALLIGIASFYAEELLFPVRLFPPGSIEQQIHDDLRKLQEQKKLPAEFHKIHEVFILDHRQKKHPIHWQDLSLHDFPQSPEGLYDLQLEIFDSQDPNSKNKDDLQFIQFSLFEKESKNKVWELNRDYLEKSPSSKN